MMILWTMGCVVMSAIWHLVRYSDWLKKICLQTIEKYEKQVENSKKKLLFSSFNLFFDWTVYDCANSGKSSDLIACHCCRFLLSFLAVYFLFVIYIVLFVDDANILAYVSRYTYFHQFDQQNYSTTNIQFHVVLICQFQPFNFLFCGASFFIWSF